MRLYRYFTLLWSDVRAYWVQGSVKHAHLHSLARLLKFYMYICSNFSYDILQRVNNKGADGQTARMHRLASVCVRCSRATKIGIGSFTPGPTRRKRYIRAYTIHPNPLIFAIHVSLNLCSLISVTYRSLLIFTKFVNREFKLRKMLI